MRSTRGRALYPERRCAGRARPTSGRARERRRGAAAVRHPDRPEGPLRGRGPAADGVEPRARRQRAPRGQHRLGAAARCGHGARRPHPHARVRRRRRPPTRSAIPGASRVSAGGSSGGSAAALAAAHGPGRAGTDTEGRCASRRHVRRERDQADARARPDRGHHPGGRHARPRRPDGSHGRGLRRAAADDGRRRLAASARDSPAHRAAPAEGAARGAHQPPLRVALRPGRRPGGEPRGEGARAVGGGGRPGPGAAGVQRRARPATPPCSAPTCGPTTSVSRTAPRSTGPLSPS